MHNLACGFAKIDQANNESRAPKSVFIARLPLLVKSHIVVEAVVPTACLNGSVVDTTTATIPSPKSERLSAKALKFGVPAAAGCVRP